MSSVATSPIVENKEMEFTKALDAILDGRKLRRVSWQDPSVCIFLADGLLKIRLGNGQLNGLIVAEADLQAVDWIIVREN